MKICLENLGKRYHKQWIFRHLEKQIPSNTSCAIIGPNGSGKSTLLKILGTFLEPTTGNVSFISENGAKIDPSDIYSNISYCAPYLHIINEFTLQEFLDFHFHFKEKIRTVDEILEETKLAHARNKLISEFSSGMQQRVKLIQAIYSDSQVLLLDEPTSNLDSAGIDWFLEEINRQLGSKTIIIASNQRYEYAFAEDQIDLNTLK